MREVANRLKKLESAVNALIAEQQLLKAEQARWQAERQELQTELHRLSAENSTLQSELERLRTARALGGDEEASRLAKARLGSLMREIDRCIALLNE